MSSRHSPVSTPKADLPRTPAIPWSRTTLLLLLVVVAATIASFWPTFQNGFVDWDDTGMFLENQHYRGLGWENIKWMFTTNHYAHYHPVTWLTLGLDYVLWGMNPLGYHLQNLVWHAASGALCYVLLMMLFRQGNAFAGHVGSFALSVGCAAGALFFAIHPLRVESVAWATERRDVVSGFFYLLTLIAYLKSHHQPSRRTRWLIVAFFSFLLSFLSKAWGITLPVVLLILDFYPLRRITDLRSSPTLRKLLLEKVPFLLIAGALAYVAWKGQAEWGIKAEDFGLDKRLANAAYGLVFYPWKTFVPLGLSPIYPLDPWFNPYEAKYLVSVAVGLIITVVLWIYRARWPWAITAWLCYCVIVSPVLGLAQSGEQIAADRYTYLSGLPFAAMVGLAFACLSAKAVRRSKWLAVLPLLLVVALLGPLTFQQTKIWRDDLSLWNRALEVDPTNFVALNGRGKLLLDRGDLDGALRDFNEAIRLNPRRVAPYTNRGMIHHLRGNYEAALADYNQSIALKPYAETLSNRGALRETQGNFAGALEDYETAIRVDPDFATAQNNRDRLLQQLQSATNQMTVPGRQ